MLTKKQKEVLDSVHHLLYWLEDGYDDEQRIEDEVARINNRVFGDPLPEHLQADQER